MESNHDAEGRLSRLILAFDESLLAGGAYDDLEERELTPELQAELTDIKRCLQLLRRPTRGDSPTVVEQHDLTPPTEGRAPDPELPRSIGRFQILDRLGAGGGGMVFLAFDPKLRRKVALKTPPPEFLLSNSLRLRFQREAEAAALLNHPHVVAVHEVGEAGPLSFIAAEYCAGGSLDQWLRARTAPVPIDQAVEILVALADGTQHAHSRGVMHRDIKPGNVLFAKPADDVSEKGLAGQVKLGDFGLARIATGENDPTRTGAILGTYAYMAPEQAQGRVREVDARSDVYSLGVVLYELLTGRPPLKGGTDAETIHRVVYDDPAPARRWRRDIPRDLEAICQKCLNKDPSARYTTADALASDLRRFQRREPIEARPLTLPQRVLRWSQRRPAAAALAMVSLAAAVALVSTIVVYNARLRTALHRTSLYAYASLIRSASEAARQDDAQGQRDSLRRAEEVSPDGRQAFTWRVLARHAWGDQIDLGRHPARAYGLAVDASQRWLASACEDGDVHLWSLDDRREARIPRAHNGEINAIASAPDAPLLATAGADGAVRLWDVETRRLVHALGPWPGRIATCVAFSPDGAIVTAGFDDGVVRFWRRNGWALVNEAPPRVSSVRDVVFSPDSTQLAIVDKQQITLWDVPQRAERWQPRLHSEPDPAAYRTGVACFSHDGRTLVTIGQKDRIARIWNPSAAREIRQIPLGEGWIHAACFSPDDRWLAIAGKRKVIWIYDWRQGTLAATLIGHEDCVRSLAFDPRRNVLFSTGDDGLVKRWDYLSAINRRRTHALPWTCRELVITSSGNKIGLSTQSGPTIVWNTGESKPVWTYGPLDPRSPEGFVPQPLAATADGSLWASVTREADKSRVVLLSGEDGRVTMEIEADKALVSSVALSPRGDVLLIGLPERVQVWDVASRTLRDEWSYPLSDISSLQFVPGETQQVVVGVYQYQADPSSRFAELRTMQAGASRRFAVDSVLKPTLALSPDGTKLAAVHRSSIVVWNLQTGREEATLRGPSGAALALAFAPDGTLASYSLAQQTLCFWDLRMAEPLHELAMSTPVDLAFLPTGRTLLMTINGHSPPGAITVLSAAEPGSQDDVQPFTDTLRTTDEIAADERSRRTAEAMAHARSAGFAAGIPSYADVATTSANLLLGPPQESGVVVEYAIPLGLIRDEMTFVEKIAVLTRFSYDHGFGSAVPWIGDEFVQCGRRGYTLCPFSLQDDNAVELESLPDGSLIVVGSAGGRCKVRGESGLVDLAVAKLTPDGTADEAFGEAGRVTLDVGGYFEKASGVEVLGDRIVIAGMSRPSVGVDDAFMLTALTMDGNPDAGFGESGVVRTSFKEFASALCYDLAQDSAGRLIAAGEAMLGAKGPHRFALARYRPDGSLDPEFGDGSAGAGRVATDFGLGASISDIELDAQQRIVAAGFVSRFPRDAPATSRYDVAGRVDALFHREHADSGGLWVRPILAGTSAATCVALLPDGRFLLGGGTCPPGSLDYRCFVARCLENGELDATFGVRQEPLDIELQGPPGVTVVPLGRPNASIKDLVIQPDGAIIALANIEDPPRLALMRFHADGQLDPAFGSGMGPLPGVVLPTLGRASQGSTLKRDARGSLLVAGSLRVAERGYEFMVARFTPEGELDRDFGEPIEGLPVFMLTAEAAERTDIPLRDLGNPATIEARYRAVEQWAVRHGYVGGYPNWIDGVTDGLHMVGAELIRSGAGEVRAATAPSSTPASRTPSAEP